MYSWKGFELTLHYCYFVVRSRDMKEEEICQLYDGDKRPFIASRHLLATRPSFHVRIHPATCTTRQLPEPLRGRTSGLQFQYIFRIKVKKETIQADLFKIYSTTSKRDLNIKDNALRLNFKNFLDHKLKMNFTFMRNFLLYNLLTVHRSLLISVKIEVDLN